MKTKKPKKEFTENMLTPEGSDGHINWFPGHMNKAIKEIKKRLKMVDIVLELRDARSPLVTGNSLVLEGIGEKSRLILINKSHLADPIILSKWDKWFTDQNVPFLFIHDFDQTTLKNIISESKKIIQKRRMESNPGIEEKKKIRMMILGLPNTGKSTLINKLSRRKATKVADKPGQTRTQLWVKVDEDIEILDTPGVMPPKIIKYEHGQWLSALHAIPDTIVTAEIPACYLVKVLLKKKSQVFKELYQFEHFDHDVIAALDHIAKIRGCLLTMGQYDYERVYNIILGDFRSGKLGLISFGEPPIK
ncbi:MAG: ribosome biogenesis GTPase YlqF [Bacteriovoracaceae bacterium]|nr:ribosome biogenesis GTPase YlqF [Bacteriovoracaceae bacterium]